MSEPDIRIFDDGDEMAAAAAATIAAQLHAAIDARGRADWATTGGSAPVGVYRQLAGPLRDAVPWNNLHVWWGDDRYVPRDHPLSNVLPLDQVLLSAAAHSGQSGTGADGALVETGYDPGVLIPPANVHAPRMADALGRDGLPLAVAWYEEELRVAGPGAGAGGFPVFDVVFLGVGPDAHILSAFPGSALFDAPAWVAAVPAPEHVEPHVARLSLNPGIVGAARNVVVVVSGAAKAMALGDVFGSERDVRRWPAQLARRAGATWFVDRAAAAALPT